MRGRDNHAMRQLSKSKLIAYRQCPKRLWLEIHRPELRDDSGSEAAFATGHTVGAVAQEVFDVDGKGINLDPNEIGWEEAAKKTIEAINSGESPVFEAYFSIPGALALADVMRPDPDCSGLNWEMIEVKASASVKDYHRDDLAVQTYIAHNYGVSLSRIGLAHIDTSFVYPGNDDYEGLFHVVDLTEEAKSRHVEVETWLREAQGVAAQEDEPTVEVGDHCTKPYTCSFCPYCHEGIEAQEDPLGMLPNLSPQKRALIEQELSDSEHLELASVDDELLSATQILVKHAHLSGETYFKAEAARKVLKAYRGIPCFLDFETVRFAVPIWAGTKPYQNIPFQYSLHRVASDGKIHHTEFLKLEGGDPRRALTEKLIEDCGQEAPVFVYNATFERGVIRELANWFPDLKPMLDPLLERIVDLHPITKRHYYHPSQNGSWGLKAVAPAIAPELSYSDLEGVQVGTDAGVAYLEAIAPETAGERREELRRQMLEYCKRDTLATVRIWQYLTTMK